MKKKLALFLTVIGLQSFAQWTAKNSFEQKVFIENKGQYELTDKAANEEILFGARQDGLHYYFTKNAIYIKHNTFVKRTEIEIEEEINRLGIKGEVEKELSNKVVEEFYQISFAGGGIGTEIEKQEQVSQVYNFSPGNKTNVSAHAYKKIIYKNLYPGIDMEFYFPEDKQGFKYNFILQPGADVSQIKMQYPLAENLKLSEGNIVIKSSFGDFTDHAPIALSVTAKVVACSFKLTKGTVYFNVGNYDKSKTLIIDPWTTTPIFAGGNKAYDVDWDNAGNCYAYGGTSPFQLIKFNAAGVQQWISTVNFAGGGFYYGDFAVDRKSGSAYIVDGFNSSGAQVKKVGLTGGQVTASGSNPLLQEMWRVAFSPCFNKIVVAGGGTSNPSYTGCMLDTNLANISPVSVINSPTGLHDMWGVALDAFGKAYFATAKTQVGSPGFDNIIYKVPVPALAPIAWQAVTTYSFTEVASTNYAPGPPNGFNGMTISDSTLYTYDSYVLNKWITSTGVCTNTLIVNGSSQVTMTYGGLTSDNCGNIFLGLQNTIKQYDGNFNFVSTYTVAGTVYDVNLASNNILYTCGNGFVSAVSVTTPTCGVVICAPGVGMQTFSEHNFSIYPNPATGNVNIEFSQIPENTKITLYNTVGQKLQSQTTNQKLVTISLQNLPEGVYVIEISTKDKTIVKKINKTNP